MSTQERYYNQLAEAGRAVVERRLQLGMSQSALASEAGVDAKTLRSLERGERWPQDTSRVKVERALGWQDGTLQALLVGNFLWRELDQPDGTRAGGLIYLRAPAEAGEVEDPSGFEEIDPASADEGLLASTLTASELAAMLVTRSQALERRVRELEQERDSLRAQIERGQHREEQSDGDENAASMDGDAQPDGVNGPASGERRRGGTVRAAPFRKGRGGRTSGSRPKLVSDNVNDDVLELPYAADNSEDPGEDYR